jgi:toxin ParE1/3/4
VKSKPVIPRALADRDADAAVEYYLGENALDAALGFIDALEHGYSHIGRYPAAGSPRYAVELRLPGLRFWPLNGFPYLLFYLDRSDYIDVWRVLHGKRDIPAWMNEELEG